MNNFLKLNNLSKKYQKNKSLKVLNNINFKFESGKVYSIIGPSGSGKSTLLNLLSLIDIPSSGFIEYNKEKIDVNSSIKNDDLRSKNIGIIYQDKNLLPDFTAVENVILPNLLISNNKSKSRELAKKLIKKFDLNSRLNHYPSELSGGERSRVAVARALVNKPALVLADEPSGNLDTDNAKKLIKLFEKINKEFEQSIVIATHDEKIASIGNKKFFLDKGSLFITDSV